MGGLRNPLHPLRQRALLYGDWHLHKGRQVHQFLEGHMATELDASSNCAKPLPGAKRKNRIVADALMDLHWIEDIRDGITPSVIQEFINLWTLLSSIQL